MSLSIRLLPNKKFPTNQCKPHMHLAMLRVRSQKNLLQNLQIFKCRVCSADLLPKTCSESDLHEHTLKETCKITRPLQSSFRRILDAFYRQYTQCAHTLILAHFSFHTTAKIPRPPMDVLIQTGQNHHKIIQHPKSISTAGLGFVAVIQ